LELKVDVLFSGDASSIWSLHLIRKAGLEVEYLVTAKASQSSRMYLHFDPDLASISARSLAIPLIEFCAEEGDEISPLIEALASLDIDGLCDGAVASNIRRNRLVRICQKLGIQLVLPLWHKDPAEILANMIEEGFKIMIVMLRAEGLDDSWLGRVLDRNNLDEFLQACEKSRISPLGEAGEFETIVLAGPDMQGRVELDFEKRRSGNLGWLEIRKSRHVN
jgi:diphthine-ammonia ligase